MSRILYAFPEPLPLPRARGVQVASSVAALATAGVAVTLAHVPGDGCPFASCGIVRPANVELLNVSRAWPWPVSALAPRWHSVRLFAFRLERSMRVLRFDAVLVRHLKLAHLLVGRSSGPVIYEAHEVFADTATGRKRAALERMEAVVIHRAGAVIANSAATLERLTGRYGPPRRSMVLPNGVNLPEALPEKPWSECARHICYSGSFFGWKGVADLMLAAAELPGHRLTLIGGSDQQVARLKAQVPVPQAEVEFLPRLPQQAVMAKLLSACIAILPNRPDADSHFTSPIKLFEYMAAGCAVVASDLPSIREILGPDDAQWFEAGDPRDLARAIRALAADPQRARRMGERLREKARSYTWAVRAARMKQFVEELQRERA